jgi:tetratricopeptide (TPR) repeat protein
MKHIFILIFSLALIFNGFGQTAEEYFVRGLSKASLEDYRGAIADFTKAIEIGPQDADAYLNRGFRKGRLKDYRGAIADFTRAIEIDPQYVKAYSYRGLAKITIGQLDSGCLDLSKAGELGYSDAYEQIRKWCN